jgi:ActR/RegA family two-component response regulator
VRRSLPFIINIIERIVKMYDDTDTAAVLTTGAIGKLAAAVAELRANDGDFLTKFANYETQFRAVIADLNKRLDERDARMSEAFAKIRSEDAKREASRATVLAWIKAQPNPAQYAVLARNNGISEAELLR